MSSKNVFLISAIGIIDFFFILSAIFLIGLDETYCPAEQNYFLSLPQNFV